MPKMPPRLSKSKLVAGLQCPRRLWLQVNNPDAAKHSDAAQVRFAQGHSVGALARQLAAEHYGAGELIDVRNEDKPDWPYTWQTVFARVQTCLSKPGLQVLFEAPFVGAGMAVLSDIVVQHPARRGKPGERWLIEVKSATRMDNKPYIDDAAFQAWIMGEAGFAPDRVFIRLIDTSFVYPGNGQYQGIFKDIEVTELVRERLPHVPKYLSECQKAVLAAEPPTRTGKQCDTPYECEFKTHCGAWEVQQFGAPPAQPISLFIGRKFMGKLSAAELANIEQKQWRSVTQLPRTMPADPRAKVIADSIRGKTHWIDPQVAKRLKKLPYPRYYFDFESINPAIPLWAGTRPYQQVPFQWSCHVEHSPGKFEHHEFLDLSGKDPRPECARQIARLMGADDEGVVIVYFKPFEQTRLKDLARDLPKHAKALQRVINKLHDLLDDARAGYYHPDMLGSWSIKAVLPTVAPELDYGDLEEVQDGGGAQAAFMEAINAATTSTRRTDLQRMLLAYCQRDTEAMKVLMQRFIQLAKAATQGAH
jgi:hypothetical protein